jgi:hypothetical protein
MLDIKKGSNSPHQSPQTTVIIKVPNTDPNNTINKNPQDKKPAENSIIGKWLGW